MEAAHGADTAADAGSTSGDSTSTSDAAPTFPQFSLLPPELRAQIWRAAVPTPGVNFFNAHSFPRDHAGANRSTSPPWLYLDVRRLDVDDADDDAAAYDPSAWQARYSVRQACREARDVCAVPDEKRASVTLTRPQRGLFIRAGDEKLRRLTPLTSTTPPSDAGLNGDAAAVEPKVMRTIQVHADDVLCLSLENCSFSMPCEESLQDQNTAAAAAHGTALAPAGNREDYDLGWSYDPQLTPLPVGVPRNRYCVELARGGAEALQVVSAVVPGMLHEIIDDGEDEEEDDGDASDVDQARSEDATADHAEPESDIEPEEHLPPERKGGLIMLDVHVQEIGSRSLTELTPCPEVYYDRFGDAYVPLPFANASGTREPFGCPRYRLTKVWPEINDVRVRYIRSAQLRSPKRPM